LFHWQKKNFKNKIEIIRPRTAKPRERGDRRNPPPQAPLSNVLQAIRELDKNVIKNKTKNKKIKNRNEKKLFCLTWREEDAVVHCTVN
jgi:hypothetical protein